MPRDSPKSALRAPILSHSCEDLPNPLLTSASRTPDKPYILIGQLSVAEWRFSSMGNGWCASGFFLETPSLHHSTCHPFEQKLSEENLQIMTQGQQWARSQWIWHDLTLHALSCGCLRKGP